jgi:hypothetical protein
MRPSRPQSADGLQLTVSPASADKLGAAAATVADASDNLSAVIDVSVVTGTAASIEHDEVVQGSDCH